MSAVSGLRPGRARQLLAAGIRTPQDLAMADPAQLCKQVQYLFFNQALSLIQSAKVREGKLSVCCEVMLILIFTVFVYQRSMHYLTYVMVIRKL